MTLDRIRELLDAIAADDGGTRNGSLLDAALPLLLRWIDPTPVTFETLSAVFSSESEGHFADGDTFWGLMAPLDGWVQWHRDDKCYRLHWLDERGRESMAVVRTLGQLNMIVDVIGQKGEA